MRSNMNTVNSFEVNVLPVNAGTMRPGELTSEHESSLWVLGEDYSFIEEVSLYADLTRANFAGTEIQEDASFYITPVFHKYITTAIEPNASLDIHPVMKWAPQSGSMDIDPNAQFYSDMDNIFGSIFPFINEGVELDIAPNMIFGPAQNLDPNASLEPHCNVIWGPSHEWNPDAEFVPPVLRIIWRAVDIDEDASVFAPVLRQIGRAVDIDEYVSVWLKDWSDAHEKNNSVDIEVNTGMLVDLWVKMYFYPIYNNSGMDACVTIKKPLHIEDIDQMASMVGSSFLKKWVEYIGAEAEMFSAPVLGITSQVGIGNDVMATISGCLIMNNNGAVIANNGNPDDNKIHSDADESVSIRGDVYVNGYMKLVLHTKDCPVYP